MLIWELLNYSMSSKNLPVTPNTDLGTLYHLLVQGSYQSIQTMTWELVGYKICSQNLPVAPNIWLGNSMIATFIHQFTNHSKLTQDSFEHICPWNLSTTPNINSGFIWLQHLLTELTSRSEYRFGNSLVTTFWTKIVSTMSTVKLKEQYKI